MVWARAALHVVVSGAGFKAWNLLLQGTMKQAPRCHPHPASCCEPKEWLVCNYVWHSSLCCAVFARWLLRNWRPPLDKLGARNPPSLPHLVLSGDTVASISSAIYCDLKMRVFWSFCHGPDG